MATAATPRLSRGEPHNQGMAQAARITRYEAAKAKPRSQGMDIGSRRIEAGHKTSIFFGNDARVVNSQKQRETLKWQKDYQAPLTARGQLENEKRQGHGPIGSTTPRIGGFSKTFREPASLAGGASVNANIVRNHNATAARTMTTFSRVKLGSVNQSYEDFRKENVFPAPKCGKPAHQPKKINTGVVAGICKPFPSAMRFHHLSEQTMSAAKPRTASSLGNCNQERPNNGRLTRKKNFELGPQKTGPADFQPPPRVNRENEVAGVRRKANFLYRETEGGNTTPRTTPRVPPGGYSSFSMNHM